MIKREMHKTMQILAGKNIIYKLLEKDKSINIETLFTEYPTDILRLKSHWDNWKNSKTNYPILFIKYETLKESIDEILRLYKEKYNLSIRTIYKNSFKQRTSLISSLSKNEKTILDNIYGDFRKEINSMPRFWLKEPDQ